MITRAELSQKVFELVRRDRGNEYSEKEIWKSIAQTDDYSLYDFWTEKEKEDGQHNKS